MKKEDIYKSIDSELDYIKNNTDKEDSHINSDFPISSSLCSIKYNLDLAFSSFYNNKVPNYGETIDYIRKIAAICVNTGIKYGMKSRENDKTIDSNGSYVINCDISMNGKEYSVYTLSRINDDGRVDVLLEEKEKITYESEKIEFIEKVFRLAEKYNAEIVRNINK